MRLSERYPVPAEIALLYEFLNSLDERTYVEGGAPHVPVDEISSKAKLTKWLRERGLLRSGVITSAQHLRAIELRSALREWIISGRHRSKRRRLNMALQDYNLVSEISEDGVALKPAECGMRSGLVEIVIELVRLDAVGQTGRLKACESDECHWVFFDRSKPSSRRWCSSSHCGNRHKTRAYRSRLKGL
jgi:predicted RNA-binding Zn ribbon-like protein